LVDVFGGEYELRTDLVNEILTAFRK
jgi:hypothetical protein